MPELCNRLEWTYSQRVVGLMNRQAPGTDDAATHLWLAEDNYSGSVQASGALCSKRVKEP
jgi:hypothetical protein